MSWGGSSRVARGVTSATSPLGHQPTGASLCSARKLRGPPAPERVKAMEDFQAFAFRAALTNVLENLPASAAAEKAAEAAEGCAFIQQASMPRGA